MERILISGDGAMFFEGQQSHISTLAKDSLSVLCCHPVTNNLNDSIMNLIFAC